MYRLQNHEVSPLAGESFVSLVKISLCGVCHKINTILACTSRPQCLVYLARMRERYNVFFCRRKCSMSVGVATPQVLGIQSRPLPTSCLCVSNPKPRGGVERITSEKEVNHHE